MKTLLNGVRKKLSSSTFLLLIIGFIAIFPTSMSEQEPGTEGLKFIIEIKPKSQCAPPKKKKRITKQYLSEVKTYAVNEAKWKAAEEYCKDRRMTFKILTENELKV